MHQTNTHIVYFHGGYVMSMLMKKINIAPKTHCALSRCHIWIKVWWGFWSVVYFVTPARNVTTICSWWSCLGGWNIHSFLISLNFNKDLIYRLAMNKMLEWILHYNYRTFMLVLAAGFIFIFMRILSEANNCHEPETNFRKKDEKYKENGNWRRLTGPSLNIFF